MANIKIRHLVQRGRLFYWQPSPSLRRQGWKDRRLSDNREAAIAEAEKINDELDRWRLGATNVQTVPIINSIDSLISAYKKSKSYYKLSARTKRDYDYRLDIISSWAGKVPADGISRRAVHDLWEKLARKSEFKANATITVLRLLLNYAVDQELITRNPAARPGLTSIPGRDVVWTPQEVELAVNMSDKLGYFNLGTAIMMSAFLAQREGDILKMTWDDCQGGAFLIHQNKTKAFICVPLHPILKARLDLYKDKTGLIVKNDLEGADKGYTQSAFTHRFDIVRREICKDNPEFSRCKYLDLRRTAIVRLAEAGCTEAQISAVSGHKIETCRRILETYLPRNSKMAAAAIDKYTALLPAA